MNDPSTSREDNSTLSPVALPDADVSDHTSDIRHQGPHRIEPPGAATNRESRLVELTAELTRLKSASPHSYKALEATLDLRKTTIHGWITGKHLPVARENASFLALTKALNAEDPEGLLRLVTELRSERPQVRWNPYMGLEPFSIEHADVFHGRDELCDRLIGRTVGAFKQSGRAPLMVIGASGAGKSSLLQAGLLAGIASRSPRPDSVYVLPGDPLLLDHLSPSAPRKSGSATESDGDRVVVLDQFEQHLHQNDPAQLRALLEAMETFSQERNNALVVGIRSDFFAQAAEIPLLLEGLQNTPIIVGSMTSAEATTVILEPAKTAGLTIEPDLLVELVQQFSNTSASAASSLPFLSHVLREVTESSTERNLALATYRKTGGLSRAIEQSAEAAFEASGASETDCRMLFSQLVDVRSGSTLTRRSMPASELHNDLTLLSVAEEFSKRRLLTNHFNIITLSHEALLDAWPRLRRWIQDWRRALTTASRLRVNVAIWLENEHDPSALLRGTQLEIADTDVSSPTSPVRLSDIERRFLDASRVAEAARELADQQATSRQLAMQSSLLYSLRHNLSSQIAVTAYKTSPTVESRSAVIRATSPLPGRRLLGAPGPTMLAGGSSSNVLAFSTSDGSLRVSDLRTSSTITLRVANDLDGHARVGPSTVALNTDGTRLAEGDNEGRLTLWDTSSGTPSSPSSFQSTNPQPTSSQPTNSRSESSRSSARQFISYQFSSAILALEFWGEHLVVALAGGDVHLFVHATQHAQSSKAGRPKQARSGPLVIPLIQTDEPALSLSVSEPSKDAINLLACGNAKGALSLYRIIITDESDGGSVDVSMHETAAEPTDWSGLSVSTHRVGHRSTPTAGPVSGVAISPCGSFVGAGSHDGTARIWNLPSTPANAEMLADTEAALRMDESALEEVKLTEFRFGSWVNDVTFSDDGTLFAAASSDGNVRIWDTTSWTVAVPDLAHSSVVSAVCFVDAALLATSCEDGVIRTWTINKPNDLFAHESLWSATHDATGALFATASRSRATVQWLGDALSPGTGTANTNKTNTSKTNTGKANTGIVNSGQSDSAASSAFINQARSSDQNRQPLQVDPLEGTEFSGASSLSPDGRHFAIGTRYGPVRLLAIDDSLTPLTAVKSPHEQSLAGLKTVVEHIHFSPNGRLLCGLDVDGRVLVWHIDADGDADEWGTATVEPSAILAAFNAEENLLAVTSESGFVSVFDVTDKAAFRQLARFKAGESFALGAAFHPILPYLAVGNADQSTSLWTLAKPTKPELVQRMPGSNGHTMCIAFNREGDRLAAGTTTGIVSLWDTTVIDQPELLANIASPSRGVYALSFSPTQQTLTAVGQTQSIATWTLDPDEAVSKILDAVGDPVTRTEWEHYVPQFDYPLTSVVGSQQQAPMPDAR